MAWGWTVLFVCVDDDTNAATSRRPCPAVMASAKVAASPPFSLAGT